MSQLLSNRPSGDIVFATIQKLMNGKEEGTPPPLNKGVSEACFECPDIDNQRQQIINKGFSSMTPSS